MKKLELGTVSHPEWYSRPGKDCMIQDSVEAYEFFKEFYTPHGIVVLGKATLTSITQSTILVWIYIDVKKQEVLSLLPIFVSDYENAQSLDILSVDFFENEIFFFMDGELYTSLFTSTGQIKLVEVRTLPILNEFYEVLELEAFHKVTELYPAKVYNSVDSSFLATVWAFRTEGDELYFKPVCIADNEKFDNVDIGKTEVFPIDLGETAVIDGETYVLRYKKEWSFYFDKVFDAEKKPSQAKRKRGKAHKAVVVKINSASK